MEEEQPRVPTKCNPKRPGLCECHGDAERAGVHTYTWWVTARDPRFCDGPESTQQRCATVFLPPGTALDAKLPVLLRPIAAARGRLVLSC